jgi:hypothetical protein
MGLPEKDVKSHNVRNEKDIVCYPTVKAHECGKYGHFEKLCIVNAKDFSEMLSQMSYRLAPAPTKTMPTTTKVGSSNAFTAHACDSSDEDEEEVEKVGKKPAVKKNWEDYSDDEELHPNVTRRKHQYAW